MIEEVVQSILQAEDVAKQRIAQATQQAQEIVANAEAIAESQKKQLSQQSKDNYVSNIAQLEQKRSRSQAALVTALLNNTVPRDEEVDYFNHFSEKIDHERAHLHELIEQYEELFKK